MSNSNEDIFKGGHVFYFEPNDGMEMGKDQDGIDVPLMPHLEDLCIAMTLTADMYPRRKSSIPTVTEDNLKDKVQRSLSWISYVNGLGSKTAAGGTMHPQIINAGVKMGDENYLTTYYTEISADSYIENEIVEGLGVTSVNISYESWYTPTITINFVDVHGSSLWGREEAIHDKNNEITSDTLLGVFFQQPYPLFRLQVKGFLGREVTYQLSVSSFKGRYNSQTGNFEATATFIGYSYSLLTDIPLKMLSFVSEMDYVGKQYWDERCNSEEWQMVNADGTTSPPVKLYDFIDAIRSAVGSIKSQRAKNCDGSLNEEETVNENYANEERNRIVSLTENANVKNASSNSTEIAAVETALEDFIKGCKSYTESIYGGAFMVNAENDESQIVMLICQEYFETNDIWKKYQTLLKNIKEFNEKNENNKLENGFEKTYPELHETLEKSNDSKHDSLKCTQMFKITYGSDNKTKSVALNGNGLIKDYKINNNSLFKDTAAELEVLVNKFNGRFGNVDIDNGKGFGEYAYLIPLGTIRSRIAEIKERLTTVGKNTENRIESKLANASNSNEKIEGADSFAEVEATAKKKIMDLVGFEPTIGNFTKMIMCHLETFVEVMMTCADQILLNMGSRTPSNFNISLDDTDIPLSEKNGESTDGSGEKSQIYPWPALYTPNPKENSETNGKGGKFEMLGWTNDYPPKKGGIDWEEQKVILSIMKAIESFSGDGKNVKGDTATKYACLPMTGGELDAKSPFAQVSPYCKDIESMSAYLGLRIANLIGVADNKCTAEEAEAIGYMDALNLLGATANYNRLKDAITSQQTDQDFASQVIKYLTCSNNTKQTNQSENGVQYNLFETISGGTAYNQSRHPMFVECNGGYKYSYTYTLGGGKLISLVPTQLKKLNGQNSPYEGTIFSSNNKAKYNNKEIRYFTHEMTNTGDKSGVNQYVSYTCNSSIIPDIPYDYTNEQLIGVVTKTNEVTNLLNQIKSLRKGEVKYKNYAIKGESEDNLLKKFIDRRFKTSLSDYYSIYDGKNNYRVLMPLINKVNENYYKEHLYKSSEDASNVTFDSQWSNASNDLCKKLTLKTSVGDNDNAKFKNGKTEYSESDVFIGELPILTNSAEICSIFGCRFYYQQNGIEDNDTRNKVKAYLLVSSMMAGVDITKSKFANGIFKKTDCSLIDYLPPFYVYFLGGMLWRKSCEKDPLDLTGFKGPDVDTSFISKDKHIFHLETQNSGNWYKLSDYYMKYDKIDVCVKNKLIREFERFAQSTAFQKIIDSCELVKSDGHFNMDVWKEGCASWQASSFDTTSPSQWASIFSNINGNYSSIVMNSTLKSTLRLLMNEKNPAMDDLKALYGIKCGYIVGRGTTNHVGKGREEVTVSAAQMNGYLKGFAERISDVKTTSDKTVSESVTPPLKDTERDIAVSYYYSLKHLWDSWLISSARDAFTIENFFNKYFVFIDSFYVNMYNTIKLNCEVILDAYETKDINVLSFLTTIASKERCMFFALPTFLDSNVLDGGTKVKDYKPEMSWKKENLKSMFTPRTFNEMEEQKPCNIFVFVYTHPYSSNACENTDKRFDSYMITDQNSWPGPLLKDPLSDSGANSASPNNNSELVSARYAYYMPCFGVAVNRGNNYIFKSINVNMDSPQVTAVSAQTLENIYTKYGADGSKRVYFHGQDIFSVYSQYAYSCEIEMLGCTQIQPLMYFQLLNIPMWRGTYMIYKVSHTLQPGNMTTKFVGMKMSRTQAPYATGYYSVPKKGKNESGDGNKNNSNSSGTNIVGGTKMVDAIFGKKGYRITSPFGKKRKDGKHSGVDLAANRGTPLYAPWSGTIVYRKESKGKAGNWLTLKDTSEQNAVRFLHCDTLLVRQNEEVKAGQKIATLGNTGHSTGPHLHLELFINGKFKTGSFENGNYVDPMVEYQTTGDGNSSSPSTETNSLTTPSNTNDNKNTSKTKNNKDGICLVGDYWLDGLKNKFQYSAGQQNAKLDYIIGKTLPAALKTDAKSIVILCGINDAVKGFNQIFTTGNFCKIIQMVGKAKKKCFICTYPLNPSSGIMINPTNPTDVNNVKILNKCIKTAVSRMMSWKDTHIIEISSSICENNMDVPNYRLMKWEKLSSVIRKNVEDYK